MADDMDKLNEIFNKVKALAKICLVKSANPTSRPMRSLTNLGEKGNESKRTTKSPHRLPR